MSLTRDFTEADLSHWFLPQDLSRGRPYAKDVSQLDIGDNEVSALVQGTARHPYRTTVQLSQVGRNARIQMETFCSCPVRYRCKHAAAVLVATLAERAKEAQAAQTGLRPGVVEWLSQLQSIGGNEAPYTKAIRKPSHAIFYLVEHDPIRRRWLVRVLKANAQHPVQSGRLARGADNWSNLDAALVRPPQFVSDDDQPIFRLLLTQRKTSGGLFASNAFPLLGSQQAELMRRLLDCGRTLFLSDATARTVTFLSESSPRDGTVHWEPTPTGVIAQFLAEPAISAVIPTDAPWYLDFQRNEIGLFRSPFSASLIAHLTTLPPLNPDEAQVVSTSLKKLAPDLPLPSETEVVEAAPPLQAVFRVSMIDVAERHNVRRVPVGQLLFRYGDIELDSGSAQTLLRHPKGHLVQLTRDEDAELERIDDLYFHGFTDLPAVALGLPGDAGDRFLAVDETLWFDFASGIRPELEADGWRVEVAADFNFTALEPDDWYANYTSSEGNQWFSLEMGITVDGQKLPLAPLIQTLLAKHPEWSDKAQLEAIPDDAIVHYTLDDGRRLDLPAGRIKPLIGTMLDLFASPAGNGQLQVSRYDLPRLVEATQSGYTLSGEEEAVRIAARLAGSEGVTPVDPPAGFNATLRPYQREGLAWLQYLRQHDLAGILADDMGLGKTAQTLAHLLIEREAGRLGPVAEGGEGPALIVLPTSLIFNWRREAEKFAPTLRVLALQGTERKERFGDIDQHDVVLTTYPLLWRDSDELLAHRYHTLVLDEAQTVKNAASKAAATVRTIDAQHRLCLTGTPLENHLGELWAQFDFLMPGLLGDSRSFTRVWRNPIEKKADEVRRAILAKRLRPFILRRRKEDVAKELPPKSIIVRTVELEGSQRDLYETVRATMDVKVRQTIASKGFARSQIVILDALLKLRQVCCDPRLLQSDAARKVKERAKLDLLMAMLPELVDEGRRVLVFSAFASMLDLIETELDKAKLGYVRLSGSTRDRETPITRFQAGEVPVFLISLKAGGVGLNLTAADTVIHYDPWWNPAAENQATDRAHRIGQTKQVFVYKLIAAGSIEEKILALQERKAALAEGILSDDAAALGKFSETDIEALLAPLPR